MAKITTSGTLFTPELVTSMFNKVKGHSSLAKLSGSVPIPFAGIDTFVFTMDGEASIVGEGGNKPAGDAGFSSVTIKPIKFVYQHRLTDEFINLAEEKNQNVHIVLSPATKEYKACLPNSSELFKDLYNVNGLEKATLINLYDSEMFDSEDFGDLDHLNSKGAEKLSNYVRNLIMK